MFNNFRLALCQFSGGPNKALNIERATRIVGEAVSKGAQVVMLPECFNSPYSTSSFAEYSEVIGGSESDSPTVHSLRRLAMEHGITLIGGSIPEREGEKIYNTSLTFSPSGELIGKHRKCHLFDINVPGKVTFYESDVLSSGDSKTIVNTPHTRIGMGICYDLRFPEYAWALSKQEDVGLLAYPGNFTMTTGPKHWELLIRARAVDNQIFVAACSQARDIGSEYLAWGYSMVVDPMGEVLGMLDEQEGILVVDIDFQVLQAARNSIWSRKHKRFELYN